MFTSEDVIALKDIGVLPREVSLANVMAFYKYCKSMDFNPFSKQVYVCAKVNKAGFKKYFYLVGINGYRTIAMRSGEYAGIGDPLFNGKSLYHLKSSGEDIVTCTITVYRNINDNKCSFTATASMDEYMPSDPVDSWTQKPAVMLSNVTEALALRKAFPELLNGTYLEEELDSGMSDYVPSFEEKQAITNHKAKTAINSALNKLK